MARIQRVFSMGEAESTNEDDYDDNWLDVNEESKTLEKQRHPTCSITKNVVVESHSTVQKQCLTIFNIYAKLYLIFSCNNIRTLKNGTKTLI